MAGAQLAGVGKEVVGRGDVVRHEILIADIEYFDFLAVCITCRVSNRAGHRSQLVPVPGRSGEVCLFISCGSMLKRSNPDIGAIERAGGDIIARGLIGRDWDKAGGAGRER